MKSIDTSNAVTLNELVPRLKHLIARQRAAFLWAGPGIGKSSIVSAIAKELGGVSVDVRLSQMQPTDIIGIPYYDKEQNKMRWAPPELLPSVEFAAKYPVVILFLDEMNSAPPAVQAAAYQLVLDRRSGSYELPENCVIIAAGNRESDRGVTFRMPSPLANRFCHFEIKQDFDSWLDWALKSSIHTDVVAYLTTFKSELFDFDPTSNEKSFPTPRSWEFVSQLITVGKNEEELNDSMIRDLVGSAVGVGTATKFMAYLKIGKNLPAPNDILTGKVKTIATREISAHYQIIMSMLFELREFWHANSHLARLASNDNDRIWNSDAVRAKWIGMMDHFFRFVVDNFDVEIGIMAIKIAFSNYKFSTAVIPSEFKSWAQLCTKYGKYLAHVNPR